VVEVNAMGIERSQKLISDSERIFLVGTGTSYHAAWAGQYILKSSTSDKRISAFTSIDFALYGEELTDKDLVIVFSHRGTKRYSLQSLEKAERANSKTILITGKQTDIDPHLADVIIQTVDQEKSSAHTISYTSALAVVCALVDGPIEALANVLSESLKLEDRIKKEAGKAVKARKIWVVGGGPNEVTAKEIALKIKETSYTQTEGVGSEELLHGPFQSTEPEDFFIIIAPSGRTQDRTLEITQAAKTIGTSYLIVSDTPVAGNETIVIPKVSEEVYSPLSCVVPLQLFSYHLALAKGTNPDSFRLEDPRFAQAHRQLAFY
jgi:glutamine---fructose-6-phosphate transaminase (isomerizing)